MRLGLPMPDTFFTRAAIGNQFRRHHVSTEKSNLFENLSEDRKASLMSCLAQETVEVPVSAIGRAGTSGWR